MSDDVLRAFAIAYVLMLTMLTILVAAAAFWG